MYFELYMPIEPLLGASILILWLTWGLRQSLQRSKNLLRRRNIAIIQYPVWPVLWWTRLQYLWNGPELLLKAHIPGVPYAIQTPETCYVHLSSDLHIRQMLGASEKKLSLHALSKDMFQPKYTMNGLDVADHTSENGNIHSRALQHSLRSNLKNLQYPLVQRIETAFSRTIGEMAGDRSGWMSVKSFDFTKRLITAANSLVFFGAKVSNDEQFLQAALAYPEDLVVTAEILRLIPTWLAPLVAPPLMGYHRASTALVARLTPIVRECMQLASETQNSCEASNINCIQFFVDANSRKKEPWPAERIVQAILGVWFAAVHQPALGLVYALEDLCAHPEYVSKLRKELEGPLDREEDIDSLPILDSFLKESARLHPSDSISVRRKVLQSVTFSDGVRLAEGDVACVPMQCILRDPALYSNPEEFDPSRFTRTEDSRPSRFIESSLKFPLWGLGRQACPGRFYASLVLKLALSHAILNYDIRIPETDVESRRFYWRSSIVPKSKSIFEFRRLQDVSRLASR